MGGSLYQSAAAAGAPPVVTAEAIKLFAHRLDFSRDIHAGDRFRLVYGRRITASGRLVQVGDLYYAEILAKGHLARFYRYQAASDAKADYVDEDGKDVNGLLLRTPVYGARITSGFGMRRHPILGYTRMHQGIDFGVPTGTPVLAAGDGVVEQARWAGGYGRWIKLRHAGGWETAYGHLSRWAAKPGQRVRQGQVIAYSGSTGESTGPHVHFEVIENGVKVNPKSAKAPSGGLLEGEALAAFRLQKTRMDALLAQAGPVAARLASADITKPSALATAQTLTR
jgi:murein DD-endopeptidase MepM/ murein hydrolase activator NlpD